MEGLEDAKPASELRRHGFREVIYRGYPIVYRIVEPKDQIEVLAVVTPLKGRRSVSTLHQAVFPVVPVP